MKRSVEYISKFNFLLNEDAYFPNNLLTLILGGVIQSICIFSPSHKLLSTDLVITRLRPNLQFAGRLYPKK